MGKMGQMIGEVKQWGCRIYAAGPGKEAAYSTRRGAKSVFSDNRSLLAGHGEGERCWNFRSSRQLGEPPGMNQSTSVKKMEQPSEKGKNEVHAGSTKDLNLARRKDGKTKSEKTQRVKQCFPARAGKKHVGGRYTTQIFEIPRPDWTWALGPRPYDETL